MNDRPHGNTLRDHFTTEREGYPMKYQTPAIVADMKLDGGLFDERFSIRQCVDGCPSD